MTSRSAPLLALLLGATAPAAAQEAVTRLENERVRVVELRYEPGAGSPLHAHEHPRVVYVLEGGTLELVDGEGRAVRVDLEPGQTLWRPAESHVVRNVGGTPVRLLETEVAGPACEPGADPLAGGRV